MDYDFKYATALFQKTLQTQYWDVDGRVNRWDFWHYVSIAFGITLVLSLITNIIPLLGFVAFLVNLALVPPGLGMAIRRMHDVGQPWWAAIIPFYNIYLACQPGESVANAYGTAPAPGARSAGF